MMTPAALATYPRVAAAVDLEVADQVLTSALKVLCALASGDGARRAWLLRAGALPLLWRLALGRDGDAEGEGRGLGAVGLRGILGLGAGSGPGCGYSMQFQKGLEPSRQRSSLDG